MDPKNPHFGSVASITQPADSNFAQSQTPVRWPVDAADATQWEQSRPNPGETMRKVARRLLDAASPWPMDCNELLTHGGK